MVTTSISGGTVHRLPADLRAALESNSKALTTWEDITKLARNEWICWVITVEKQETRDAHVKRAIQELKEGKRRPCCWYGCLHRKDKAPSPSVQNLVINQRKSR